MLRRVICSALVAMVLLISPVVTAGPVNSNAKPNATVSAQKVDATTAKPDAAPAVQQLMQVRWATHTDAVTGASKLRLVFDVSGPVEVDGTVTATPTPRLVVNVKGAIPAKGDDSVNLDGKIDIVAGTYSKALGSQGGYVVSSKELIDYLRYYSRAHMFSTVMTPSAAAASLAALFIVLEEPERQKRLTDNINYLKSKLLNLGFNIGNTESAIFPIIIGDDHKVKEFNKYLHQNNIFANTVVYPAVPIELSRLRISIMQGHTMEDFDYLLEHLEKKGKELRII